MKKKLFKKLSNCTYLILFLIGAMAIIYAIYSNIQNGSFAVEFKAQKWVNHPEEFGQSRVISENRAVAFIGYNCAGILKPCQGQYLIFIDKIDGKWVVNESSKAVLW